MIQLVVYYYTNDLQKGEFIMLKNLLYRKCCFTGHRPQSLPWGYNESGYDFQVFKNKLKKAIATSINEGFNYFISGMALGVDMIAAELILEFKKSIQILF